MAARKPPRTAPRRADLGAPVDGWFARQREPWRTALVTLRGLVEGVAPTATSSLKWGMPFFCVDGEMACALGAHKAHVNLVLAGAPDAFPDPKGLLIGAGRGSRHFRLTDPAAIPAADVKRWVRVAVKAARARAERRASRR